MKIRWTHTVLVDFAAVFEAGLEAAADLAGAAALAGAGAAAALGFGAALAPFPCNTAFSEYSFIYKYYNVIIKLPW